MFPDSGLAPQTRLGELFIFLFAFDISDIPYNSPTHLKDLSNSVKAGLPRIFRYFDELFAKLIE